MSDVIIKWSGKEYKIVLSDEMTVQGFKHAIEEHTGVKPHRQKIVNLKHLGKVPSDETRMSTLNLRPGMKMMVIGSLESAIEDVQTVPTELPTVINDLTEPDSKDINIKDNVEYLAKVRQKVESYKIHIRYPMRPGKKLLVLDIDYTLFDHRSTAETGYELMRPYLHEFLTAAYQNYDLVIWSATNMRWIEEKMKVLGVNNHPLYNIAFYLDSYAMISVETPEYGVIQVKPLGVIWGKFSHYTPSNTIMFDDLRRNFLMNPQNGLKIRPFKKAHRNRDTDKELIRLSKYLQDIAQLPDLSNLRHSKWEKYREGGYSP